MFLVAIPIFKSEPSLTVMQEMQKAFALKAYVRKSSALTLRHNV
jgi:hypothetical protein